MSRDETTPEQERPAVLRSIRDPAIWAARGRELKIERDLKEAAESGDQEAFEAAVDAAFDEFAANNQSRSLPFRKTPKKK